MQSTELPPGLDHETLAVTSIEQAHTIPSGWYTNPAFLTVDQRAIFDRAWQYAGHVNQIPERGDYLNVQVGSESIVVVRGDGDVIRAFFNVCRHRGGPLVMDRCGRTQMLQCKYHGWTYRLDGSLRGVPRFNRVDLFDKKDYGLREIEADVWEGLIFVRIAPGGASLNDVLAGIAERIAPMELNAVRFYRQVTYDIHCNWKVYVDNYLEGYHLPFVHPELCDVLEFNAYVTETYPTYSLQHSPINEGETPYGSGGGSAFYYFVYPNVMMNILPGRLQTNVVIPLAADRTRVVFDYYYADVAGAEAVRHIEDDILFSDRVQQEDIEICEFVQRGLASQAYDQGRFSVECEEGVYHFQTLLKASYRSFVSRLPASL